MDASHPPEARRALQEGRGPRLWVDTLRPHSRQVSGAESQQIHDGDANDQNLEYGLAPRSSASGLEQGVEAQCRQGRASEGDKVDDARGAKAETVAGHEVVQYRVQRRLQIDRQSEQPEDEEEHRFPSAPPADGCKGQK